MKLATLKGIIFVALGIIGALVVFYLVVKPQLISVKKIENNGTVDAIFVGPEKYQSSFAKSLRSAEESAKPFRRACELMEVGRYEEALKALDKSLRKSTRSIERSMVYDAKHEIYQKTGNLEKELEAIELWFKEAGEKANSPRLEQRAAELREALAAKKEIGDGSIL